MNFKLDANKSLFDNEPANERIINKNDQLVIIHKNKIINSKVFTILKKNFLRI